MDAGAKGGWEENSGVDQQFQELCSSSKDKGEREGKN